ncbi:hypothetical protein RHMOL_Rhmol06G0079200 [Rhododendron molle]|uniref:Uncharacterized protein n=1 Tax=Rhododendron molle TaxID=49168 RepID=A0ACC0N9W1_RHOML|nr:hypothetical protein RHMOL_Rhmol06G0079200 [Rhododendron molle]
MPSSLVPEPAQAKQLGELLQEQQEPFILEIYLHEKGYLKKSASWGPKNKIRKVIPSCSKIVIKAVFKKLVESFRNTQKARINSASGDGNHSDQEIGRRSDQYTADSERFSSASGTTLFHSSSGSDTEGRTGSPQPHSGNLVEAKEIETDRRRVPWRCREENSKGLSPVPELEEEAPSHENSQVQNKKQRNAKTKDSILATSFCKLVFELPIDEPSTDTPSQYLTGKRVLQQSKQLLFDCVRELVETHRSEGGRGKEFLENLGPAEIWKILGEDIRTWSKLSGNESNTTQLVHFDFAASAERWKGFYIEMREIGAVIGDAILEDFSEEIAVDMIELERGNV